MAKAHIWVLPARNGRLTRWVVKCDACDSTTQPVVAKREANQVAEDHAKFAHGWDAVVAVKKGYTK
jgi:hypothetical protein